MRVLGQGLARVAASEWLLGRSGTGTEARASVWTMVEDACVGPATVQCRDVRAWPVLR